MSTLTPPPASVSARTSDGDPTVVEDRERVLALLGDEDARRILAATRLPRTVAELQEDLDLSRSTAYRKVSALHEAGLLEPVVHGTGNTPTRYRCPVEELVVTLTPVVDVGVDDGATPE